MFNKWQAVIKNLSFGLEMIQILPNKEQSLTSSHLKKLIYFGENTSGLLGELWKDSQLKSVFFPLRNEALGLENNLTWFKSSWFLSTWAGFQLTSIISLLSKNLSFSPLFACIEVFILPFLHYGWFKFFHFSQIAWVFICFSCVQLFATLCSPPGSYLSRGFSRQEY